MPNHVGHFNTSLASGQVVGFDNFASMIAAGSAAGGAITRGASNTFPRAASLYNNDGVYPWDLCTFRLQAGSAYWTSDPIATPNASIGMGIVAAGNTQVFPGNTSDFRICALSTVDLRMLFLQGDHANFL